MSHFKLKNEGFTLIELTLSMSFISVLLLAIAMTVMQISSIYNKGVTLKATNQAGRSIGYELQKSISQVMPFNIDVDNPSSRYVTNEYGGRLCTGQYSYVWNYGSKISDSRRNRYSVPNNNVNINFIKVVDSNANYCTDVSSVIDYSKSVELLPPGEHNLAVHSFDVVSNYMISDPKTNRRLYNIQYTIGTNNQSALTGGSSAATKCKDPGQSGSDPDYCSVNQFNISVLAGSSVE